MISFIAAAAARMCVEEKIYPLIRSLSTFGFMCTCWVRTMIMMRERSGKSMAVYGYHRKTKKTNG